MDDVQKGYVKFDDFARKFHPSGERRKFEYNTDKDAKPWEKPEAMPYVHGLKANAEEVGGHDDVWSIDMRKLTNIVHLKAERKSLSTSMGNAGVANPSILKLLLIRFSNVKKGYLNSNEFIQAMRTSKGLDVKNVPNKDFNELFKYYNNKDPSKIDDDFLSINAFCKQVLPKGIVFAGKAAISRLFTDDNNNGNNTSSNSKFGEVATYKIDNPPWDRDNETYNSKKWQTIADSTINESGRQSSPHNFTLHRRAEHTIKALHEIAGNNETRMENRELPKNESSRLGIGSAEAAKLYYKRNGGGLHAKRAMSLNAAKPPNTTRFRRESLVGKVLHEDAEKRPIISNHQATIGQTSKMKWPRKEIQIKLASETSDEKGPLHHAPPHNSIYNVYGAVQYVPSRPSTSHASSRRSSNSSSRRRGESPRLQQHTPSNSRQITPQAIMQPTTTTTTTKQVVTMGTQTNNAGSLKLVPYWKKNINRRRAMTSVGRNRNQRARQQKKVQRTRNAIPTYKNSSPRREHMIAKLNHEKMLKARQAAVRASSRQRSRTPGIKFTSLSGAY